MDLVVSKKKLSLFIFYIILLIPFFGPRGSIFFSPLVHSFIFKYCPIVISLFLIIYLFKIKYIQLINIHIFCFFVILCFSTLINKGDFIAFIDNLSKTIGLCLLINYSMKNNSQIFISSFSILLKILVFINFLTIILFPNGMYLSDTGFDGNWFLGYRNVHILFIFPAIILDYINTFIRYGKISLSNYIFYVFCFFSLLLAGSATSALGVFLLFFLYYIFYVLKKRRVSFNFLLICYFILYFSIVVFRLQNIFSHIIVDILHRDLTFTNRIYIWDNIFKYIKNNPLFGYGIEFRNIRLVKTIPISYHAHNQFLEIIYQSGFVGFFSFSLIVLDCLKVLSKHKTESLSVFLFFSILSLFIMMLTEAYSYTMFIYLFVLFYNYDKFFTNNNSL